MFLENIFENEIFNTGIVIIAFFKNKKKAFEGKQMGSFLELWNVQ